MKKKEAKDREEKRKMVYDTKFIFFRYIAQCTIRQHYYPEGNYGYIVVISSVMVQILSAGIHGAVGILLVEGMKKYRQNIISVGMFILSFVFKLFSSPLKEKGEFI